MHPVSRSEALTRSHFHALLRDWYESGYAGDTVGDATSYGGRAWVWIAHSGRRWHLDADTTHEGVGEYLELLDAYGDGLAWTPAGDAGGRPGWVVFGPERRGVPGFHLRPAE